MTEKYICVEFASPAILAINHVLPDINEAVEHASHNLYVRHKVKIKMPLIVRDGRVIIKMEVPDEKAKKFSPGNHLRGISVYLLKKRPDYYEKFRIGKRLMNYVDVSGVKRTAKVENIEDPAGMGAYGDCSECGAEVNEQYAYCPNCGLKLEWE